MHIEDAIVRIFIDEGVTTVFGLPGFQLLKLYDTMRAESRIQHVLCKHEQGVGFAAFGYALAKNAPSVCVVMPGPGLTNILSAVGESFYQSVPLVVITIDNPPATLGTGAFHELNSPAIFAPVVKAVLIPKTPSQIPDVIRRGFFLAQSGRPGPVFINLPLNLFAKEVEHIPGKIIPKNPEINRPDVRTAAGLLSAAKHPLIWAGEGVIRAQAMTLLAQLAEILDAPVMTNLSGRGAFDETHPLSLRIPMYDLSPDIMKEADLILAVGLQLTSVTTRKYTLPMPANLIHIDIAPEKRCGYKKRLEIKACPGEFLSTLVAELQGQGKREKRENTILKTFEKSLQEYRQYFEPIAARETPPITPPRFFREFIGFLGQRDFVYVTDSVWAPHCFQSPAISAKDIHISIGSFGCLGLALPAAIGAALASPERLAVSISGDGAFFFNCQELSTAADLNLKNLLQIVLVNDGYGSLKHLQTLLHGGRTIAVDWKPVDHVKLAESMGVKGLLIREPKDIKKALDTFEKTGGPLLIAVEVENIPTMPESAYRILAKS
ncbi:MAG TPA: thiamine pyrophosphate-binding protein [Thermodesulfobacteriota bacterium]|nr:thiamine pyrophosphate-binding protein [Thermodesulfobacteriota bacterium]